MVWYHRPTGRQGTRLCHVTWELTYTRTLVNIGIKRRSRSVHLRKVVIQPYTFDREIKQAKYKQVALPPTPYLQTCSNGTRCPSILQRETSASALRTRTINYIYHGYLSPLLSSLPSSHLTEPSTDRIQHHYIIPTAMKLTVSTLLALIASAVALPTAQRGLPAINQICIACQSSCETFTKHSSDPGAYRQCMLNTCAGRVQSLVLMTARRHAELTSMLVRYRLVDY
jgi:hypothetical protein